MTLYAGETVEITLNAKDFDGSVLDPSKVTSVKITITDDLLAVLVNAADMSWSTPESLWFYKWDTTLIDVGKYLSKVLVTGLDGTKSWEFTTVRLKTNRTLP